MKFIFEIFIFLFSLFGLFNSSFGLNIFHYNDAYDIKLSTHMYKFIHQSANQTNQTPIDLILFSGDTLFPSALSSYSNGSHMIDFMNLIKVDYAVIGNHEFDLGIENFEHQISNSETKWLSTNLYKNISNTTTQFNNTSQYEIYLDPTTNSSVGLIGLVSDWTNTINAKPGSFVYEKLDSAINRSIKHFQSHNVSNIIALTHCTEEDDLLIASYPEIGLVLGGHEHVFYINKNIIKSGYDFKGHTMINFDTNQNKISNINQTEYQSNQLNQTQLNQPQSNLLNIFKSVLDIINKFIKTDEIIGSTDIDLINDCRFNQCKIGTWITQHMSEYFNQRAVVTTDTNMMLEMCNSASVLLNSGTIRFETFKAGHQINIYDFHSMISYDDKLYCIRDTNLLNKIKSDFNIINSYSGDYLQIYEMPNSSNIILNNYVLNMLKQNNLISNNQHMILSNSIRNVVKDIMKDNRIN